VPRGARVLLVFCAAWARPVRAEAPAAHARLVYFVDPTATGCPSAEAFRAAASARAGHELFGEPADVTIDVTLRRVDAPGGAATYVATVGLPDAPRDGAAPRELRSEVSCDELATAAALVVSIALDPESILRAPPPAPPPPPPPPEAPRTWRALVGIGARGAWGMTPEATGGLALSAAAVASRLALGAEIAGFLATDATYTRGSVSVLPLTLSLLPCASSAALHLELCAVARLGVLRGAGSGFTENFSRWRAFGAAGARAGAFVDVARLRLRASVEGTALQPRTSFDVGENTAYTTRSVSAAAGLDALLFFR
jgi:hypothetical protein